MKIRRSPVLAILLIAPFVGEVMSTATPPLDALPPWKLPLLVALYGCGALLCRELAVRYRLGRQGLFMLAAAYAMYEEALIVHSWFDPEYHDKVGIGSYSVVWHTNLMIAMHLTAFHIAVSIGSSVLIVERLHPGRRDQPWVGRREMVIAAVAFLVVVPLGYESTFQGPVGPVLIAAALCVLLAVSAFLVPRPPRGQAVTQTTAGWMGRLRLRRDALRARLRPAVDGPRVAGRRAARAGADRHGSPRHPAAEPGRVEGRDGHPRLLQRPRHRDRARRPVRLHRRRAAGDVRALEAEQADRQAIRSGPDRLSRGRLSRATGWL